MNRFQVVLLAASILVSALVVSTICFIVIPSIRKVLRAKDVVPPTSVIPAKNWKRFSSDDGAFSVLFPGTPENTNIVIEASGGTEISQPCYYVWGDRQTEYAVSYGDFPLNSSSFSPGKLFDICESGIAKKIGKIIKQHDVSYRQFPARDFEFVAGGKANYSGKIKFILIGHRMYQVEVLFVTQNPHPDDYKIFLSSFSYTGQQSGNSP